MPSRVLDQCWSVISLGLRWLALVRQCGSFSRIGRVLGRWALAELPPSRVGGHRSVAPLPFRSVGTLRVAPFVRRWRPLARQPCRGRWRPLVGQFVSRGRSRLPPQNTEKQHHHFIMRRRLPPRGGGVAFWSGGWVRMIVPVVLKDGIISDISVHMSKDM